MAVIKVGVKDRLATVAAIHHMVPGAVSRCARAVRIMQEELDKRHRTAQDL
jgi:hypothetical protein